LLKRSIQIPDKETMIYSRDKRNGFYWFAPVNGLQAWGGTPPPVAFDRDVLGNRQAWKAAKKAAKEYYKAGGYSGPRIKLYGSDFIFDEYKSVGGGEYVYVPRPAPSPETTTTSKARQDLEGQIAAASGLPNYSIKRATSTLPNGWRSGYLLRSDSVTPRAFANQAAAEEIAERLRLAGFEAEAVQSRGWRVAVRKRRR
jgi:hypothetical protein